MIKDLLLEIMTEELPHKILQKIENTFTKNIFNKLKYQKFIQKNSSLKTYSTSRRIGLYINNVKIKSKNTIIEKKILPLNIAFNNKKFPTYSLIKKISKILKIFNIYNISINKLIKKIHNHKEYFFFHYKKCGLLLKNALQIILEESIDKLSIYKFMKYQIKIDNCNTKNLKFIRPLINLLVIHGKKNIPLNILNINSKLITYGNRFLKKNIIKINDAKKYSKILIKKGKIIPNFYKRKLKIKNLLLTKKKKYKIKINKTLLNEITALIEWPTIYKCKFKKKFLKLPKKCIKIIIQDNQKHFLLKNRKNQICQKFLIICNTKTKKPKNIIKGYEQTIFAMLSEAKSLIKEDIKEKIFKKIKFLKNFIYHNKIGNQLQRTNRIKKITKKISNIVKCNKNLIIKSTPLLKIDLLTKIVKKFPNLQGIMGMYYAKKNNETFEVAKIIYEHYLPKFSNDKLPTFTTSLIFSIADKLEIIIGIWNINYKPKGNKDPFGLRRNIIALLRILIEKKIPLSIPMLITQTIKLFKNNIYLKKIYLKICNFIYKKLAELLLKYHFEKKIIKSFLFKKPPIISNILYKLNILKIFINSLEYKKITFSNKRILNITKNFYNTYINKKLLYENIEKHIYNKMIKIQKKINININKQNYINVFKELIIFNKNIDIFFKKITINTNITNLKNNRKAILVNIYKMYNQILNISYIEKKN